MGEKPKGTPLLSSFELTRSRVSPPACTLMVPPTPDTREYTCRHLGIRGGLALPGVPLCRPPTGRGRPVFKRHLLRGKQRARSEAFVANDLVGQDAPNVLWPTSVVLPWRLLLSFVVAHRVSKESRRLGFKADAFGFGQKCLPGLSIAHNRYCSPRLCVYCSNKPAKVGTFLTLMLLSCNSKFCPTRA